MLKYSREDSAEYSFYVALDDEHGIVAMFATSSCIFVDHDGEFQDLPLGKPWGYLDDDFEMHSGTMYPTLEIDYLAVRRDLRNEGIGTEIKVTPQSHSTKNKDSLICKSIPRSMIPSGWQNASKQVKALV